MNRHRRTVGYAFSPGADKQRAAGEGQSYGHLAYEHKEFKPVQAKASLASTLRSIDTKGAIMLIGGSLAAIWLVSKIPAPTPGQVA